MNFKKKILKAKISIKIEQFILLQYLLFQKGRILNKYNLYRIIIV